MTPLKVTQILYSGLGGHGAVVFPLRDVAEQHQAWQDSLLFVGIEPLLPEYKKMCSDRAVDYIDIRTREGGPWFSWREIYRALQAQRPDVILLHSVKTILPCWLYAKRKKIPLIAVEHQPNALKSRFEWVASYLLMSLADRVVLLTDMYYQQLQASLGYFFRSRKVSVIHNGIDTSKYCPITKSSEPDRRKKVIGMAARFSNTKRQETLVDALGLLLKRPGEIDWRLSLAGDGDTLEAVARKISDMGLQDRVELTGYLGETALLDWFSSIDIYAHSSDGETLSTSLLQAMSMQLPIVGSDSPGIRELLNGDIVAGQLVPNGDAASFARVFMDIGVDPDSADKLARAARELVIERYSSEAMFQQYNELIQQQC